MPGKKTEKKQKVIGAMVRPDRIELPFDELSVSTVKAAEKSQKKTIPSSAGPSKKQGAFIKSDKKEARDILIAELEEINAIFLDAADKESTLDPSTGGMMHISGAHVDHVEPRHILWERIKAYIEKLNAGEKPHPSAVGTLIVEDPKGHYKATEWFYKAYCNHLPNLWLISAGSNLQKGDSDPSEMIKDNLLYGQEFLDKYGPLMKTGGIDWTLDDGRGLGEGLKDWFWRERHEQYCEQMLAFQRSVVVPVESEMRTATLKGPKNRVRHQEGTSLRIAMHQAVTGARLRRQPSSFDPSTDSEGHMPPRTSDRYKELNKGSRIAVEEDMKELSELFIERALDMIVTRQLAIQDGHAVPPLASYLDSLDPEYRELEDSVSFDPEEVDEGDRQRIDDENDGDSDMRALRRSSASRGRSFDRRDSRGGYDSGDRPLDERDRKRIDDENDGDSDMRALRRSSASRGRSFDRRDSRGDDHSGDSPYLSSAHARSFEGRSSIRRAHEQSTHSRRDGLSGESADDSDLSHLGGQHAAFLPFSGGAHRTVSRRSHKRRGDSDGGRELNFDQGSINNPGNSEKKEANEFGKNKRRRVHGPADDGGARDDGAAQHEEQEIDRWSDASDDRRRRFERPG